MRGKRSGSRRSPELGGSRGSHSWLRFGEQSLPHLPAQREPGLPLLPLAQPSHTSKGASYKTHSPKKKKAF